MTFQYGKWSEAGSDRRYVFQCDYTIVGPGEIDVNMKGLFNPAGSIWKALYEHKDGKLRIVWNNHDPEERPTHFDAMMDRTLKLHVLKKVQ